MTTQSAPQLEPVKAPRAAGWLSPAEAAALLTEKYGRRTSVRTVQLWCHRSREPLAHVELGSRLLIHRDELERWLERWTRRGEPTPSPVTNGGTNGE